MQPEAEFVLLPMLFGCEITLILLQHLGDYSSKESTLQNGDLAQTPCSRVEETALQTMGSDHPNFSHQLVATPGWTQASFGSIVLITGKEAARSFGQFSERTAVVFAGQWDCGFVTVNASFIPRALGAPRTQLRGAFDMLLACLRSRTTPRPLGEQSSRPWAVGQGLRTASRGHWKQPSSTLRRTRLGRKGREWGQSQRADARGGYFHTLRSLVSLLLHGAWLFWAHLLLPNRLFPSDPVRSFVNSGP